MSANGAGFRHDIAGGNGNLVITSVQSPNFVHGVSGWQIAKSGSAEFNSLTIRGTYFGADFILNSSGLFFYSAAPAPGVPLIGSWAPVATTDPFGTSVPAGIQIINSSGVGVALTGTTLSLPGIGSSSTGFLDSQAAVSVSTRPQTLLSGASNNNLVPQILMAGESTNASALPLILLQAFSLSGSTGVAIAVQVNGSLVIGPSGLAVTGGTTTDTLLVTSTTTLNAKETITAGGLAVTGGTTTDTVTVTGKLTATGGTSGNLSVISTDSWNSVTLPTGMTGTIRVKLLPLQKMAALDINVTITSTGTSPVSFTAGSLPSASYYPLAQRQYDLSVQQQFTATSNASPRVNVPVSGALQLDMPGFATAGSSCLVSGTIVYPLD